MFKSLNIPLPTGLTPARLPGRIRRDVCMGNVPWKSDTAWVTHITLEEHVVHSHA